MHMIPDKKHSMAEPSALELDLVEREVPVLLAEAEELVAGTEFLDRPCGRTYKNLIAAALRTQIARWHADNGVALAGVR